MNGGPGGAAGAAGRARLGPGPEHRLLLLGLGLFVLVNVLTASRSPAVWQDEAQLVDPAMNFLSGRGFTSSAWVMQTKEEFFAGNSPLYSFLLVPWMAVLGLSITAARSLNFVLMALSAWVVWRACKDSGCVRSPGWRLGLVLALTCGHGVTFCHRSGRLDVTLMLLAALTFWAAVGVPDHRRGLRLALMAMLAMVYPWAGLHLLLGSAVVFGCLMAATPGRWVPEAGAVGIGGALGLGVMRAVLGLAGLWSPIGGNLSVQTVARGDPRAGSVLARVQETAENVLFLLGKDLSTLMVMALGAGLVAIGLWRLRPWDGDHPRRQRGWSNPACMSTRLWPLLDGRVVFSVVCFAAGPLAMKLLAKYPTYMTWIVYAPICIAVASLGAELSARLSRPGAPAPDRGRATKPAFGPGFGPGYGPVLNVLALATALACTIPGLGGRLAMCVLDWRQRDYAPVAALVARHVKPGEHVYGSWETFYALRWAPVTAYFPGYLGEERNEYTYRGAMRPEERALVSRMFVRPEDFESTARQLGGRWIDSGQAYGGGGGGPGAPVYSVRMYTREGAAERTGGPTPDLDRTRPD